MELLELLLSPHMVWGGIFIFFILRFKRNFGILFDAISDRIKNVKEYKKTQDGHEVKFDSQSQIDKAEREPPNTGDEPRLADQAKEEGFVWDEDRTDDITIVRSLVKSERGIRYYWEYNYLNYFLVRQSQLVLDWLSQRSTPLTEIAFENYWLQAIPAESERVAIFQALKNHHLIQVLEGNLIELSPKGQEYIKWRGALPPLTESIESE